MTLVRT